MTKSMIAKDLKEILKDIPDDSVIAVAANSGSDGKQPEGRTIGESNVVGSRIRFHGKNKELVLYTYAP